MSKENQIFQMLQSGDCQYHARFQKHSCQDCESSFSQQLEDATLESMDESEFHRMLFPEEAFLHFARIHKELLKSGVTLKLL